MTRYRIVVVEPNLELSEVLRDYLARSGFEVSLAQKAQEALQLVAQQIPALVLCEEELPDMDGLSLSKAIRGLPAADQVALMLFCGDSTPEHRLACLDAGATDYLLKPFSMKELVRRCRQQIGLGLRGAPGELSGDLTYFKTTDILQMLEANQATGVLHIETKDTRGEIHLLDGYICGGFAGPDLGEEAIYRLIPLRLGRFTFLHSNIRSNIQSVRSTTEFMMEALRRHDEKERAPASRDLTG